MKKEVEIRVPAKRAHTRTVKEFYCDIPSCTNKALTKSSMYVGGERSPVQCSICKRDVCDRHRVYDPDEPGDYPDKFCTICATLYLPERNEMQERHWKEEEKLRSRIRKESLAS